MISLSIPKEGKIKSNIFNRYFNFQWCRRYGISLNPKKSILGVTKGKLLGHVVTKEGVKIDSERVKSIKEISLPKHLKALRSFF